MRPETQLLLSEYVANPQNLRGVRELIWSTNWDDPSIQGSERDLLLEIEAILAGIDAETDSESDLRAFLLGQGVLLMTPTPSEELPRNHMMTSSTSMSSEPSLAEINRGARELSFT